MTSNLWVCKKCGVSWRYPVEHCIYCGSRTKLMKPKKCVVRGITKIFAPSTDHPEVPYYSLLLEDEHGNLHIKKSHERLEIGRTIAEKSVEVIQRRIGIVGTGIIGIDIARLAAQSWQEVVLKSRIKYRLHKAIKIIEHHLLKMMSVEEKNKVLRKVKLTTNYQDLAGVDIVIESVIEDIQVKKEIFKKLDKVCPTKVVLATNTSSLSIDKLASVTSNPSRVIGMHFFNPVAKMRLVEVIYGKKTSQETIKFVVDLAKQMHKVPVLVKDSPGFIVNRALMPYLNEAIKTL